MTQKTNKNTLSKNNEFFLYRRMTTFFKALFYNFFNFIFLISHFWCFSFLNMDTPLLQSVETVLKFSFQILRNNIILIKDRSIGYFHIDILSLKIKSRTWMCKQKLNTIRRFDQIRHMILFSVIIKISFRQTLIIFFMLFYSYLQIWHFCIVMKTVLF